MKSRKQWGSIAALFGTLLVLPILAPAPAGAAGSEPAPQPSPAPTPAPIVRPIDVLKTGKTCGVGVCKRTVAFNQACTPGQPAPEDGWLFKIDPGTSSWDGNCDGKLEKKSYANMPMDVFETGCVSPTPNSDGKCVAKRIENPSCGQKWAIMACAKTASGKCNANLQGEVVQSCR